MWYRQVALRKRPRLDRRVSEVKSTCLGVVEVGGRRLAKWLGKEEDSGQRLVTCTLG